MTSTDAVKLNKVDAYESFLNLAEIDSNTITLVSDAALPASKPAAAHLSKYSADQKRDADKIAIDVAAKAKKEAIKKWADKKPVAKLFTAWEKQKAINTAPVNHLKAS